MRLGWLDLVEHHATLRMIAEALLNARTALDQEFKAIQKRLYVIARGNPPTRRLMTTPGVGAIVALTFSSAIDDPARFRSSRMVGAHFGLTPRKYQSGETDVTGRISKIGPLTSPPTGCGRPIRGSPSRRLIQIASREFAIADALGISACAHLTLSLESRQEQK